MICCALRPLLVLFNIIPHRVTQTQAMWQLIYGPTPSVADTRAPVITRKSSSQHSIPHESGASGFLWSGWVPARVLISLVRKNIAPPQKMNTRRGTIKVQIARNGLSGVWQHLATVKYAAYLV